MIKFGFQNFEEQYPNWSKHHKTIGIHVKRVYKDGEVILPSDEQLKKIVEENESMLIPKFVRLFGGNSEGKKEATDYYLPLKNLEYKEPNFEYYSIGASNTKQETCVRLKFMIEYDTLYLDYQYNSTGTFATSFKELLDGTEDIVREIAEKGGDLAEIGIEKGDEEDYRVVIVDRYGKPTDYEISEQELLESIVGVEIYDFKHEIVD